MTAPLPSWLEAVANGTLIRTYVQPKASRTETAGPHGEPPRLKIRVAAPPVDGEANEELLCFLKKKLGIPAQRIHLVRGRSSRSKDVLCEGLAPGEVLAALGC